jgi:hypothetical protein
MTCYMTLQFEKKVENEIRRKRKSKIKNQKSMRALGPAEVEFVL